MNFPTISDIHAFGTVLMKYPVPSNYLCAFFAVMNLIVVMTTMLYWSDSNDTEEEPVSDNNIESDLVTHVLRNRTVTSETPEPKKMVYNLRNRKIYI